MFSKITGGETDLLFSGKILNKYQVNYYRCKETGFIQTEEPYWLNEAYSSAITSLDLGLLHRNLDYSEKLEDIFFKHFDSDSKFLDYAGGYGIFTRLMRDKGYDFYHSDKFCENLFAKHFELEGIKVKTKFEATTAFELFEHLNNPIEEIKKILAYSDSIIFSTELIPNIEIKRAEDWWYFSPETGQHISFYTTKSLEYIAKGLGCNMYSNGSSLHLLTMKDFSSNPLNHKVKKPFLTRKLSKLLLKLDPPKNRPSLLQTDWRFAKECIISKQNLK